MDESFRRIRWETFRTSASPSQVTEELEGGGTERMSRDEERRDYVESAHMIPEGLPILTGIHTTDAHSAQTSIVTHSRGAGVYMHDSAVRTLPAT